MRQVRETHRAPLAQNIIFADEGKIVEITDMIITLETCGVIDPLYLEIFFHVTTVLKTHCQTKAKDQLIKGIKKAKIHIINGQKCLEYEFLMINS